MLKQLRKKIDLIDKTILDLIALRMEIAAVIGHFKRSRKLKTVSREREIKLLSIYKNKADSLNLDKENIGKIFKLLIKMSVNTQKNLN